MKWPFPQFAEVGNLEYADLVPFSDEVLTSAKAQDHEHDFKFWRKLYREHHHDIIPFYTRGAPLQDIESSTFLPTREFPWTDQQIREHAPNAKPTDQRQALFHRQSEALQSGLGQVPAPFNFNVTHLAIERPEYFEMVRTHRWTIYVPWEERRILHFLWALLPESELDQLPRTEHELTSNEALQVRMLLLKYWEDEKLHLKKYVSNLSPKYLLHQQFRRIAPLDLLLIGYSGWSGSSQTLAPDRLTKAWCNYILVRSFDFLKLVFPTLTYHSFLRDLHNCQLYSTPSGPLLLENKALVMFSQRELWYEKYPYGEWRLEQILQQAQVLLNAATHDAKTHETHATESLEVKDDDSDALSKAITAKLRSKKYFGRIMEMLEALDRFLHTEFLTNAEYRLSLCKEFTSLEALRALFVSEKIHHKESKVAMQERIKKIDKITVPKKLRAALNEWLHAIEADSDLADRLSSTFQAEAQSLLYRIDPVILSSARYKRYIAKEYKELMLPEVKDRPKASTCTEDKNNSGDRNKFLELDNAQSFANAYFTPASPHNGEIFVHSVGAGKTCLTIPIACEFSRAGYRVVWVTKTSLRHQVLKNHVSEICNTLIRMEYNRLLWLEGQHAATQWLNDLPLQTNFQSVLKMLKQKLGLDWINMSYRQFSNALEFPPRNKIGREWNAVASDFAIGDSFDPLRKTLVIIDEGHKLFTGELDRTELPNVAVIKERFQASFQMSRHQRARLLMLTATPTTQTVLPLFNMINLLHVNDVFPFEMQTIDPHITSDREMTAHVESVRAENRKLELKAACELFPLRFCRDGRENDDEDEDEPSEVDTQAFFDTRAIVGATTFQQKELRNNLEDFWHKSVGLISYYNISADYSKFPRTEYRPIIIPSCSMLQEKLMVAELTSNKWRDLKALGNKIRQIAAWAQFQSVNANPHQPTKLDHLILQENAANIYFEPTVEDLIQRRTVIEDLIRQEKSSVFDESKFGLITALKDDVSKSQAKYEELAQLQQARVREAENAPPLEEEEPASRISRKKEHAVQKGLLTRQMKSLLNEINAWNQQLTHFTDQQDFFESQKQVRLKLMEKRLLRTNNRINSLNSKRHTHSRKQNILAFLAEQKEAERAQSDELQIDDDEEEEEEEAVKPDRRGKKKNQHEEEEDDEEEEEEEEEENGQDLSSNANEKKFDAQGKDYTAVKSWFAVKGTVPYQAPQNPKRHYFDQPETFDAEQFRRDIPLFSPKLEKLVQLLAANDRECQNTNPEKLPADRYRKILIFCEDIHAIRAVAGGLMAHGWQFGMKKQWVKWRKDYIENDTNKKLGHVESKSKQLTWMPDTSDENFDYKRFLILTRSKLGGVSGATLNEFAIQSIGAKGPEATYNHTDNLRGQNYRIVLIDRNFMEGIDLPSTYCYLYDSVLAQSTRTQIVGRISRFCGNSGLPFVENYGWPQTVYRFGLKFHTAGLHFTVNQLERLADRIRVDDSLFAAIIPEPYRDGFLEKLEKNLFSPVELQVLLDDNMEIQRVKKKTLDVYMAMMEKVSIGELLYAPAMRNLQQARTDLDELLMEEEETEMEYKQDIFAKDHSKKAKLEYNLRSQKRQLMDQFQVDDSPLFSLIARHVRVAMKNTPLDRVPEWKTAAKRERFFKASLEPALQDADFITLSPDTVKNLMNQILDEAVKNRMEAVEKRDQKRHAQTEKKLEQSRRKEMKEFQSELMASVKVIFNLGSRKMTKEFLRKLDAEALDKVYQSIIVTRGPAFDRAKFDEWVLKVRAKRETQGSKKTRVRKIKDETQGSKKARVKKIKDEMKPVTETSLKSKPKKKTNSKPKE